MVRVLLVCTTNACLSPALFSILTERLQTAGLAEAVELNMAGAFSGLLPQEMDRQMQRLLERKSLHVLAEHRSRGVTMEDIHNHDLIIVMNEDNYWFMKNLSPQLDREKVKLFSEFSGQLGFRNFPDPQEGTTTYETALEQLSHGADHIVDFLLHNYSLEVQ